MNEYASGSQLIAKWDEIKLIVEALDHDVTKNARGTAAAGTRARKGLRLLKSRASELVKMTLETDKEKKVAKKASK
jgi:hypothetical protein